MGCDIHMILESRIKGIWIYDCDIPWQADITSRNYTFFGALAGVRYDGPAPRGLPDDVCPATRARAEGEDWHSHSYGSAFNVYQEWCTTNLMPQQEDWVKHMFTCGGYGAGRPHATEPTFGTLTNADQRIVYWFDN